MTNLMTGQQNYTRELVKYQWAGDTQRCVNR